MSTPTAFLSMKKISFSVRNAEPNLGIKVDLNNDGGCALFLTGIRIGLFSLNL